jgi:hypothetical protein
MASIETINSPDAAHKRNVSPSPKEKAMPLNNLLHSLLAAYASGVSGSSND